MIYIFDIDGTLADLSHRLHFIQQEKPDWHAFYAACTEDKPIQGVIDLANALWRNGSTIVMVSGRSDEVRDRTIRWLIDHRVNFDALYMRTEGDYRKDEVVKAELLSRLQRDYTEEIGGVFEDRQQVVDMYRSKGLRVFQVADGIDKQGGKK